MKRSVLALLVILLTLLSAGTALAQDGLYAPVLPDDIAMVRVINTATDGEPVTVDMGTTRIGPVASGEGSSYHPCRPGIYVVFAAGTREAVTATASSFHTVIISGTGILVVEDERHDDPLRAQIILYNASTAPVRLDSVVPEAPLFESVAPGGARQIAINAIPLSLRVTSALDVNAVSNPKAGAWDVDVELTRGDSYAFVVTECASGLSGFVLRADVAPAQ